MGTKSWRYEEDTNNILINNIFSNLTFRWLSYFYPSLKHGTEIQESCSNPGMWREDTEVLVLQGNTLPRDLSVQLAGGSQSRNLWVALRIVVKSRQIRRVSLYKRHWYSSIIGTWFHPTCFSLYPTGIPYCHIPLQGTLHFRAPVDFHNLLAFSWLPGSRGGSSWRMQAVPSSGSRVPVSPVPVPPRYLPSAHKVVAQHQINDVNTGLAELLPSYLTPSCCWEKNFGNFLPARQLSNKEQHDASLRINIWG